MNNKKQVTPLQEIQSKEAKEKVRDKIILTKHALLSNKQLYLFWFIVTYPVVLLFSLLLAVIKTVLIWLLPDDRYSNLVYVVKHFFTDVVSRRFKLDIAWDRCKLLWTLFTKGAEEKKSYGSLNPDKVFYVIRPYYFLEPNNLIYRNIANLLTQYYYVLQKLSYAINKGYIPVVDWQNYGRMPHAEKCAVNGTLNSWEYYWLQPSSYELEEVYQSQNVILSTRNIGEFGFIPTCSMNPPYDEYATELAKQCPQYDQFIRFNKSTENYINNKYDELFPKDGQKVLGVVIRGSAYGSFRTPNSSHPKQVSIYELIKFVRLYMERWGMQKVFFVNEVQELVDIMKEEFGNVIIVLPRMRDSLTRKADGKTKNPMYRDGQRYQTNLDYVTEIALLSRCDSVIGSMSSGLRTALIWNARKYENVYVIDKGLW